MSRFDGFYELISSLTSSEKRYIRLLSSRQHSVENSNLLQLFDLATTISNPDDEQVIKKSRSYKNKKRLSVDKAHLFALIMKALRSFHEERTIDIQLKELLLNSALLFDKRLYESSQRELLKAEKIARRFERYGVLLEIQGLQIDILIEKSDKELLSALEALYNDFFRTLDIYVLEVRTRSIRHKSFVLLRTFYQLRDQGTIARMEHLFEESNIDEGLCQTLLIRHNFLSSKAIKLMSAGKFSEAADVYGKLISEWNNDQERAVEDSIIYKKLLSNYLSANHSANKFHQMPEILDRIRSIPSKSNEEEAEQFQNTSFMELLYIMNTDKFELLDQLVSRIEKGLLKYASKINKARWFVFHFNVAMAYFIMSDTKKAHSWLMKIIQSDKSSVRIDIQGAARIMRMAIYYQQDKQELLEYDVVNTERFLRVNKLWHYYESTIIRLFKKLVHVDDSNKVAFFADALEQINTASEGATSASMPGISELVLWLRSYCDRKTIRELLVEEYSHSRVIEKTT